MVEDLCGYMLFPMSVWVVAKARYHELCGRRSYFDLLELYTGSRDPGSSSVVRTVKYPYTYERRYSGNVTVSDGKSHLAEYLFFD